MIISLFGANNPSGAYLLEQCKDAQCITWGRKLHNRRALESHIFCDLSNCSYDNTARLYGVIVSFAPIWLLSSFLSNVYNKQPNAFLGLRGIVACSSSSYLTKRFAFSKEDQELATILEKSHQEVFSIAERLQVPCRIIAPTLIYGKKNDYYDRNVSVLIRTFRLIPVVFIPKVCGKRQPIHASQLAECVLHEARTITQDQCVTKDESIYCVGGDETIEYGDMLARIKKSLPISDNGRKCKIVRVPDWLFFFFVSVIVLYNPKLAESLYRIKSNLSGFKQVHTVTRKKARKFPLLPLPIIDCEHF
jgi:hypothetical protein